MFSHLGQTLSLGHSYHTRILSLLGSSTDDQASGEHIFGLKKGVVANGPFFDGFAKKQQTWMINARFHGAVHLVFVSETASGLNACVSRIASCTRRLSFHGKFAALCPVRYGKGMAWGAVAFCE